MTNLFTLGLIIGLGAGFAICLALVEIMDRVALRRMRDG